MKRNLKTKEIIAAYERHKTMRGAAKELGCSPQNVSERLRRVGYSVRYGPSADRTSWLDHEIEVVKLHYKRGLSASQIASRLGRSRNEVIGKAHRMGL